MKKLINKKLNLFGKEVSIFLVVMLAITGFASAALVGYLSNTVGATFTTESPLYLEVSDGSSSYVDGANIPLGNVYGGNIEDFNLRVTNNADTTIESVLKLEVSTDMTGATCDDFTNFYVMATRNDETPYLVHEGSLDPSICTVTEKTATILIPSVYLANEVEVYEVEVTFAANVEPAIYTVTAQEITYEEAGILV